MKRNFSILLLALAAAGQAIVIGTKTTDFACVVPIFDDANNLVGTGVLVGKSKVITADHVSGMRTKIGQTTFKATRRVSSPTDGNQNASDLAVLCFEEELSQEFYTIDTGAVANGSTICIVGYGPSSTGTASPYTLTDDAVPTRREAKNTVDTKTTLTGDSDTPPKQYKDDVYCFDWDGPPNGVPNEGITTPTDSGGAMFVMNPDGTKRFAGMILGGDADTSAKYGDKSYASVLKNNKDWISSVPEPSTLGSLSAVCLGFMIRRRRTSRRVAPTLKLRDFSTNGT